MTQIYPGKKKPTNPGVRKERIYLTKGHLYIIERVMEGTTRGFNKLLHIQVVTPGSDRVSFLSHAYINNITTYPSLDINCCRRQTYPTILFVHDNLDTPREYRVKIEE